MSARSANPITDPAPVGSGADGLLALDLQGDPEALLEGRMTNWQENEPRAGMKRIFVAPGPELASVLEARWRTYGDEFKHCSKKCSEEAVHELRVAIRRLLSQLTLIEVIRPGPALAKLRQALKRQFKQFGELRDVHVQRQLIQGLNGRFPVVLLLDAELARREKRLVREAARSLKAVKERKLLTGVVRVLASLMLESENADAQRLMLAQIMEATGAAFSEVNQRRLEASPSEPATIHRVRLAYKKFRYMVETLSPTWTGYTPAQLRRMAYYQRRLGRIQDLEVLSKTLNGFAELQAHSSEAFRPAFTLIDRRRREAMRAFLLRADEISSFWPPHAA